MAVCGHLLRPWKCALSCGMRGLHVTRACGSSGRYRYELGSRLAFGAILPRSRKKAEKEPEKPEKPATVTIISETGFPGSRLAGAPKHRVTRRHTPTVTNVSEPTNQAEAADSSDPAPPDPCLSPRHSTPERLTVQQPPGYTYDACSDPPRAAERTGRLPSVTRILQATMSEESRAALLRWEERMVLKHGRDGFDRIKKEMFQTGRQLHAAVQSHLQGGAETALSPTTVPFWDSLRPALAHVDTRHVAAAEKHVQHEQLGYCGIVDCVASFRSTPMVIEWKTSRRPKTRLADLYDHPIQAAAYIGAYNFTHRQAQVQRAAVVIAYQSGQPASVHVLSAASLKHYWALWLGRLLEYQQTIT